MHRAYDRLTPGAGMKLFGTKVNMKLERHSVERIPPPRPLIVQKLLLLTKPWVERTQCHGLWLSPHLQTQCHGLWLSPHLQTQCHRLWLSPHLQTQCHGYSSAYSRSNPNVTWYGLLPESNCFFRGPCTTFPPNFVKIEQTVFFA